MGMSDRIKEQRVKKGLTQEDLGAKLGLQKSAIAKYENGRVENIKRSTIQKMAEVLDCSPAFLMGWDEPTPIKTTVSHTVRIPVYGSVSAGPGCFADGNIESFIDIPEEMAKHGEFFGLRVKGDSMEPDIKDGDIVIVKKQEDLPKEGKTVIAIVNGDEGFCKRLAKYAQGLGLVSNNPNYMPKYFSAEEVRELPVKIIGVVERLIRDL